MKTVKNFTTTLPIPILNWLDNVSKETKKDKNYIIENALKLWKKEYLQKQITHSYKNAMSDSEWINFGNSGLEDWGEVEKSETNKPKPVLKKNHYV